MQPYPAWPNGIRRPKVNRKRIVRRGLYSLKARGRAGRPGGRRPKVNRKRIVRRGLYSLKAPGRTSAEAVL